jgi:hypothetical protein
MRSSGVQEFGSSEVCVERRLVASGTLRVSEAPLQEARQQEFRR